MKRYQGHVGGGCYLNTRTWGLVPVPGDSGLLPDPDPYLKIPGPVVPVLVLALSGVFVVFLPCLGFVLVLKRLWEVIRPRAMK